MKSYTNEEICKRRRRREFIVEKVKLFIVIIIGIIVIYNISLIFQSIIFPDKTPSFLGIKTFTIISGSMMPDINAGDIIITKEVTENELQEGDIITYRKNNEMITHRIRKINDIDGQKSYVTKGDSNNTEDIEAVYYADIEGKVIKTIPYIGNITIALKNKLSILIILLIFFIIYYFDAKSQNKKAMRMKKKESLNKRRE